MRKNFIPLKWRKPLNPLNWLPWIYGKYFAGHHPIFWYGAIILFGALMFYILGAMAADKYNKEHPRSDITNEDLAQKCEELANDIAEFIYIRKVGEPSFWLENKEDKRDEEAIYKNFKVRADYSTQTGILYDKKFEVRLREIAYLLEEHGHKPDESLHWGSHQMANRKVGQLIIYARIIKEGKIIDDQKKTLNISELY